MHLKRMFQWARCVTGRHRGANFCAFCGRKLLPALLFPFRVQTIEGEFVAEVSGYNDYHVKQLFRHRYDLAQLVAIRLPFTHHEGIEEHH